MSAGPEKATRTTLRYVDDRLGSAGFLRRSFNKVFPDHWSFMLGEIALYSFIILLLTGTYLTFFFHAEQPRGHLQRQLRAAARRDDVAMPTPRRCTSPSTCAAACSSGRSTTGPRCCSSPRSACTCSGCSSPARSASRVSSTGSSASACSCSSILEGFAGYSLPDDLLSGTGLRIADAIMRSIPSSAPTSPTSCSAASSRARTSSPGSSSSTCC